MLPIYIGGKAGRIVRGRRQVLIFSLIKLLVNIRTKPPRRPVVCYIVCLSFFPSKPEQWTTNMSFFLFFFSLCDSVVRLSIVYKKNSLSCLFLSLAQSLSLILTLSSCHGALEQTWLAFEICNFANATRLSPSAAQIRTILPVPLFLSVSLPLASRDQTTQTLLYSLRDEIFLRDFLDFVNLDFSFVLLSVEAIYYFKRHCSYDIDRLLWKKGSPDFRYLFLS